MLSAKQEAKEVIKKLPEDCSFEDIQYHLYVIQKIKKGLDDEKEGKIYSQKEMEKQFAQGKNCGSYEPNNRKIYK